MSSLLEQTFGLLTPELSIDFGHDRLRIASQDLSNQIDEAALLIVQTQGKQSVLYASGNPARSMQGRMSSQFKVQRPLFDNQLKNSQHTQSFLNTNVRRALGGRSVFQPRTVVSLPERMNDAQRNLFAKLLHPTCGKEIFFVPSILCGALGVGIDYESPKVRLIVDIGHASTRVAAVCLSCVLAYEESPIGGHYLNRLIVRYLHQHHGVHIDTLNAEDIKITAGNAFFPEPNLQIDCVGRESDGRGTKRVRFHHSDIFQLFQPPLKEWVTLVQKVLSSLEPAAFEDIADSTMILIGGGSQLGQLAPYLSQHLEMDVECSEFPRESNLRGAQLFHRNHNLLLWAARAPAT